MRRTAEVLVRSGVALAGRWAFPAIVVWGTPARARVRKPFGLVAAWIFDCPEKFYVAADEDVDEDVRGPESPEAAGSKACPGARTLRFASTPCFA